ncbi:MAG: gamma-glutamylcyclotransferase [Planctomycetaceae bacterium]|nr:gamma-glutamylcyclotransferase [Planctomycetaceae bacterium]
MNDQLPVFVFGTLRHGRENHHLLAGRFERFLVATLSDYQRVPSTHGYPLIDVREGESVEGELYFLSEETRRETMIDLDHLEGLPPGGLVGEWYERVKRVVATEEGDFLAWVYVKPRE